MFTEIDTQKKDVIVKSERERKLSKSIDKLSKKMCAVRQSEWLTWSPAPMSSSSRFTCTPAAICGDCSSNASNTVHVLWSNP